VGVSAVPTPLSEMESDFFFFHKIMIASIALATVVGFDGSDGEVFEIDSKAMRKVNEDEDVLIIAEINSAFGAGTVMRTGGRILIKEH